MPFNIKIYRDGELAAEVEEALSIEFTSDIGDKIEYIGGGKVVLESEDGIPLSDFDRVEVERS